MIASRPTVAVRRGIVPQIAERPGQERSSSLVRFPPAFGKSPETRRSLPVLTVRFRPALASPSVCCWFSSNKLRFTTLQHIGELAMFSVIKSPSAPLARWRVALYPVCLLHTKRPGLSKQRYANEDGAPARASRSYELPEESRVWQGQSTGRIDSIDWAMGDRDCWARLNRTASATGGVEDYVLPLLVAFGCKVVHGQGRLRWCAARGRIDGDSNGGRDGWVYDSSRGCCRRPIPDA